MSHFRCPVCKQPLTRGEKSYRCSNGHSYDRARQGYVNLLLSQASGKKRHGDDRQMVVCRTRFLEKGYYSVLRQGVIEAVMNQTGAEPVILDAGCGEGWYTDGVRQALADAGRDPVVLGVDISKDALKSGGRRNSALEMAVASLFDLPLADCVCDVVLNLFAPLAAEEFRRVLKPGGILLRAIPLERHLWGLKSAVYDAPYENEVERPELDGFKFLEQKEIRTILNLDQGQDISDLFRMTPYYYKTGAADQAKADALTELKTELEFGLRLYRKQ